MLRRCSLLMCIAWLALAAVQIGRAQSELQSRGHLVCRLLLEKKKTLPSFNPSAAKLKLFSASALRPHTRSFLTQSSLNLESSSDCFQRSTSLYPDSSTEPTSW